MQLEDVIVIVLTSLVIKERISNLPIIKRGVWIITIKVYGALWLWYLLSQSGQSRLVSILILDFGMNSKTQVKGTILFACLGLAACSQSIVPEEKQVQQPQPQQFFEEWSLKPGSVYDGDTLRVIRDNEELKIRFCGIDAPEEEMAMGV